MKEISKGVQKKLLSHSPHHTTKHMKLMIDLIKHGLSFPVSHQITQKHLGK